MPEPIIAVAHVAPCTEAEGPGRRFAVWFQGCPLRCPGCCNPEYLPFTGGTLTAFTDLADAISRAKGDHGVEGITLLGGEPFAHAPAGLALARHARSLELGVMVFTGFTLEQLYKRPEPEIGELLGVIDILVDGPYLRDQADTARRWIGSRNQRIHFLTNRHRAEDPCWRQPNTLEIRVAGRDVTVNGFPAAGSAGLWKGWKRKAANKAGAP